MKNKGFIEKTDVEKLLHDMDKDPNLQTKPGYIKESPVSKEVLVSFTDRHLFYLDKHPHLNPEHYLANLRIMIKIRP
jgi:hypothetical protein